MSNNEINVRLADLYLQLGFEIDADERRIIEAEIEELETAKHSTDGIIFFIIHDKHAH